MRVRLKQWVCGMAETRNGVLVGFPSKGQRIQNAAQACLDNGKLPIFNLNISCSGTLKGTFSFAPACLQLAAASSNSSPLNGPRARAKTRQAWTRKS